MENTINKYSFYRDQHHSENRWNYFASSVFMYGELNPQKGIVTYKSFEFHIFWIVVFTLQEHHCVFANH
jgi:hypothetical protein